MPKKSTIYEVAHRSGVSTATVSRVMVNGAGASDATRQRVLTAARDLGWVPNGSARSLAVRRTGIVGLLFPELGTSGDSESDSPLFVDQVIRGAERAATSAGNAVLIAATRSAAGRDLAWSLASKVDGLVILAGSLSDTDLASIARSVPVVALATPSATPSARQKLEVVDADNRDGAQQLTRHLVDVHGYRDIAFIAGPARSPDSDQRFIGYRQALQDADLCVPDAPDAHGDFTEEGGERAMHELVVGRDTPPRAVVVGNDQMAMGAMSVLRSRQLRVPGDVAVTGFDDISAARHLRPALTTVRQPMREMGEAAVRMVLERVAEPSAPSRSLVLPTQVVVRRSCGCPAALTTSARKKP